jgi:hypothetical protein
MHANAIARALVRTNRLRCDVLHNHGKCLQEWSSCIGHTAGSILQSYFTAPSAANYAEWLVIGSFIAGSRSCQLRRQVAPVAEELKVPNVRVALLTPIGTNFWVEQASSLIFAAG